MNHVDHDVGLFSINRPQGLLARPTTGSRCREGDIEKVFGRPIEVERDLNADYLFRARIPEEEVAEVMRREVMSISYGNFKDSVRDEALHDAYLTCWQALARTQDPPPYSGRRATRSLYEDEQEIAKRSQKPIAQRKGGK